MTPRQKTLGLMIRLIGLLFPILFVLFVVLIFVPSMRDDKHAERTDLETIGSVAAVFGGLILAIVGVVVAVKGPEFGPEAEAARKTGRRQILAGVAAVLSGLAATAIVSLILAATSSWTGIFAVLFVGLIGAGAIAILIGIVALLTGRSLGDILDNDA
jgi:hypothetical protein